MDPIERLARDDKWQLGCGDGIIFAPQFPKWLDAPGFWDDATLFHYSLGPLFTVAILDADGRELPARVVSRRWTPSELTLDYRLPQGITATEVRTVQPGGIFASEWRVRTLGPATLHLIGWTVQRAADVELETVAWSGALGFVRTATDRQGISLRVACELTCTGEASSWSASLADATPLEPLWTCAPFAERWHRDRLRGGTRMTDTGAGEDGVFYAAVHRAVVIAADEGATAFAMRLTPADPQLRSGAGARSSPTASPVVRAGGTGGGAPPSTLGGASRRRWSEMFALVPDFRCSDPYFENYYWYRWFGLWLNAIAPGTGNYQHATMCDGVGEFHQPSTRSAAAHVRELRWMHDPSLARGVLRTFFAHQKADGSVHGHIGLNHLEGPEFYHADWGGALVALDAIAPDDRFTAEMYFRLTRYADWLLRTRDPSASGLFDIVSPRETGQELMARDPTVDPRADGDGWTARARLQGIDATVYAYNLFRALEGLAGRGGQETERARWRGTAERTFSAVRERMWDPSSGMFFDIDAISGHRTRARTAVAFYPYATDLTDTEQLPGLEKNLLDPARFWTPFPVPSAAVDDPTFSATGEWKGTRHAAPWNGRVWPIINSHVLEGLLRHATPSSTRLRDATVHLLERYVRMMFQDGDVQRPNSYEHYNPYTGAPSAYRGLDDCQHGWVNDLLMRIVIGIRPHETGVTIDPFPFRLDYAEARDVRIRGHSLGVRLDGERVYVDDGGRHFETRIGEPIELAL
jgi:hypothetical protein